MLHCEQRPHAIHRKYPKSIKPFFEHPSSHIRYLLPFMNRDVDDLLDSVSHAVDVQEVNQALILGLIYRTARLGEYQALGAKQSGESDALARLILLLMKTFLVYVEI
mmetsp:Transcript_2701/g.4040  ORF Transcript_2701/g.4040 Transcript_2701/m.4040 type:complete len:107 (-) Transcript_2701:193-513(-)